MKRDITPFDEGFKARQRGQPKTANPNPSQSKAWFSWNDGWEDLDEHLRDRDEALASIGWYP